MLNWRHPSAIRAAVVLLACLVTGGCGRDDARGSGVPSSAQACIDVFNLNVEDRTTFLGKNWGELRGTTFTGIDDVAAVVTHGAGTCKVGFLDRDADLILSTALDAGDGEALEPVPLTETLSLDEWDQLAEDNGLKIYLAFIGDDGISTRKPSGDLSGSGDASDPDERPQEEADSPDSSADVAPPAIVKDRFRFTLDGSVAGIAPGETKDEVERVLGQGRPGASYEPTTVYYGGEMPLRVTYGDDARVQEISTQNGLDANDNSSRPADSRYRLQGFKYRVGQRVSILADDYDAAFPGFTKQGCQSFTRSVGDGRTLVIAMGVDDGATIPVWYFALVEGPPKDVCGE